MKFITLPLSTFGKLSVILNIFFVIVIISSITLVQVFGILSFDNRWWDITVALLVPTTLVALVTGLITLIKHKDRSYLLYTSIGVSIMAILFILLHSLFIND